MQWKPITKLRLTHSTNRLLWKCWIAFHCSVRIENRGEKSYRSLIKYSPSPFDTWQLFNRDANPHHSSATYEASKIKLFLEGFLIQSIFTELVVGGFLKRNPDQHAATCNLDNRHVVNQHLRQCQSKSNMYITVKVEYMADTLHYVATLLMHFNDTYYIIWVLQAAKKPSVIFSRCVSLILLHVSYITACV